MQTLPLVTHNSLDKIIAWHKGTPVSVQTFLADAEHLAALMPAGKHVLNVCSNRYHFAVGLAAAIISNKISLLPPTHTPDMVQQLQAFAADVFCLHDNPDCVISLPKLLYPVMPAHADKRCEIPQIAIDQLVAIVFTSGSTGAPLPYEKRWGSLVDNVQAQAITLGLSASSDYTIVGTIPPQHMYGFESTVLLALQSGNALCSAQPFYPADICSAMESITASRILVSTPLHLRLLLESGLAIPETALVLSATAPLSESLAYKVEASFRAPLIEIYGSTETGQIASRHTSQGEEWLLFPGVTLSQQEDKTFAQGGHVGNAVPLSDVIELVSPVHFLLKGRVQDLINIAGKRNSLANLNHHLNSIEGVIDGAFFMPDEVSPDHVTRLSACVVAPSLTSAQLLAALRLVMDAVFLPRPLLFVESLPRNSTGKLPREALQKLITEHMNNEASASSQALERQGLKNTA